MLFGTPYYYIKIHANAEIHILEFVTKIFRSKLWEEVTNIMAGKARREKENNDYV